jgi:hypothetical protein
MRKAIVMRKSNRSIREGPSTHATAEPIALPRREEWEPPRSKRRGIGSLVRRYPRLLAFCLALGLSGSCVLGIILANGKPLDARTWVTLLFGLIFTPAALAPGLWKLIAWLSLVYYLPFLQTLESHSCVDLRGGRRGVALSPGFRVGKEGITFLPGDLRFGHDGPNTELIESYLGRCEPEWQYYATLSTMHRIHEPAVGPETYNLIFEGWLPDALDRLPSEEARVQVLRCLTDSQNLLRRYQGLLLTCVKDWRYPEGYDALDWWERHQHLFRQEYDPRKAAVTVAGWYDMIQSHGPSRDISRQLRFVRNYGMSGFWVEAEKLEEEAERQGKEKPDDGIGEVVWWLPK